jgi:hypothetical protein
MADNVRIIIKAGEISMEAELVDTETARAIVSRLPITGRVRRWGEEIYFSIPVEMECEADARDVVEAGELGYWPEGTAFCIFFGKTPASRGDEIRAASPVNVFGRVAGDATRFGSIADGEEIVVTIEGGDTA